MDLGVVDPATWMRQGLLGASRSTALRSLVEKAPVSRDVVARFVAGASTQEAVEVSAELRDTGRLVTIDYLGEDTLDLQMATQTRDAYLELLSALADRGLTGRGEVEVSLKLSALGQALGADGEQVALDNARQICQAAANAGTTVTLDMEDHATTDSTLSVLRELRQDWPWVGAVLQSYLYRTEQDCRDLAYEGSRVRLCKGAYREPESVAYQDKTEVDKAYVRCLKILMAGDGYPMVASHDPRIVEIAGVLADRHGRTPDSYEFQMLLGIRPDEQRRLAAAGARMRVYLPYGDEWYGYLVRRMAERPANLAFFLRAVATTG
ncbi:proline dehydrogenase family protein [Ornithinimicrobium sediminis]|uniref:proline dehydrogenase family protein n=1 Tax=Ornithinimicrobium sediminis TaxID=2904603 RepID=UPI001E42A9E1|nr:proline dehydrogenase family protein [Ornithinimicrobium sediminis]MCE0485775.1 proline dehydrogenase family protein [Ornithinimicrobium sediminis]